MLVQNPKHAERMLAAMLGMEPRGLLSLAMQTGARRPRRGLLDPAWVNTSATPVSGLLGTGLPGPSLGIVQNSPEHPLPEVPVPFPILSANADAPGVSRAHEDQSRSKLEALQYVFDRGLSEEALDKEAMLGLNFTDPNQLAGAVRYRKEHGRGARLIADAPKLGTLSEAELERVRKQQTGEKVRLPDGSHFIREENGGLTAPLDDKVFLPDGSYYIREADGGITVPLPANSDTPATPGSRVPVAPNSKAATNDPTSAEGSERGVRATFDGVVGTVGWQNPKHSDRGMGWRIYVNRPDGSRVGYGHMDPSSTLKHGTVVKKGDIIGRYANPSNGHSSGPHVHVQAFDAQGRVVDSGGENPLARRGRRTERYGVRDRLHPKRHQGNDWAEFPR